METDWLFRSRRLESQLANLDDQDLICYLLSLLLLLAASQSMEICRAD